ncbi:PcfJ domain-containing protein [Selenomonas sp. KH1T6]|uniref:PcfJ domain-containing protein n=1 Tax=Selenomonas sp. KH1T6 TaxID=3158784 RepID=UPI0008A815AF|nr:PcfJ-like protein [Selenomonas ruminantium]
MIKKTFYFDVETEEWQEGTGHASMVEDQINLLAREGKDRYFIPYQWTVAAKDDSILEVSLDIFMVGFAKGKVQSIQEKQWLIECDFAHSQLQAWPMAFMKERQKGWVKFFHCPEHVTFPDMMGASYVEIPTVVTDTAIYILQGYAEREFGFRPTSMGSLHGLKHMIAFCNRPLDMNIYLLRHVIGEPYELLFPREQRDNYHPLCYYLQIDRPPKSLRRFYGEMPENLVAYVLLRQLGFRDINVIRRFFQREVIFGYHLAKLTFHPETGKLEDNCRQQFNPYLEWMECFCRWYLKHRSESQLANYLQPLVALKWTQDTIDILRMFVVSNLDRDDRLLTPETRRRLLREGFTSAVHDDMMHDLANVLPRLEHGCLQWYDIPNTSIQYTDKEKAYADEIDGYRFVLPKESDDLRIYGKRFHNCVSSYRLAVLERKSLIMAMVQEDRYIACIEIQQRRVVQAFGPCNQQLSPPIQEVIKHWAKEKKIVYGRR